eukprot:212377_1
MSSKEEPGSRPAAKQALAQKRGVRQLNTRLEIYVRANKDKDNMIKTLKHQLAQQEVDSRNKIKQNKLQNKDIVDKLRKENENLAYDNKCVHQELNNALKTHQDNEDRAIQSESHNAALTSEIETLKQNTERDKEITRNLRNELASLKYKYNQYESEKKKFQIIYFNVNHKNVT